jgi:nuclear pore complex protein Nup93
MMKYDRTTKRLNEQRKQGFAFAIVSAYAEASTGQGAASAGDARTTQLADTWRLLGHLVRERDVVNGEFRRDVVSERQYANVYLSPDQDSGDAKELRRMVTSGALQFLEEQYVPSASLIHCLYSSRCLSLWYRFMHHVEKTLQARPAEANLGGVPTVQNKIRAYINVKYSKMGQWTATNLEVRRVLHSSFHSLAKGMETHCRWQTISPSGHASSFSFVRVTLKRLSTLQTRMKPTLHDLSVISYHTSRLG